MPGSVQSKWVAERLVEAAAGEIDAAITRRRALKKPLFAIFRPGVVTGHSLSGVCNLGDSVNRYVVGFRLLGYAPPLERANVQVDMSPVDWVANCIVTLSLRPIDSAAQTSTCPTYTLHTPSTHTPPRMRTRTGIEPHHALSFIRCRSFLFQ